MARISYEDMVNLISPEDINTLKMCICKASGLPPKFLENPAHEHVEPPRKKYISLPPRNESGSRSNIWLCDQVPENVLVMRIGKFSIRDERMDFFSRHYKHVVYDLRNEKYTLPISVIPDTLYSEENPNNIPYQRNDCIVTNNNEVFLVTSLFAKNRIYII